MSNSRALGFVDVEVENISNNPYCDHGPTILFKRHLNNGEIKQYYSCSAYRDRKYCSFYSEIGEEPVTKKKVKSSKKEKETFNLHIQNYNKCHADGNADNIWFCNLCSTLLCKSQVAEHSVCDQVKKISSEHIQFPTKVLSPKSNPKCEAQYFFTDKCLQVLIETLQQLCIEKLLCIGAPRLHEVIRSKSELNIKSLLFDIDERFSYFFSTNEFVLYNLFTHYFFCGPQGKKNFQEFLKGSEKILLFIDPPYGGRMELISNTLHMIEKEWRLLNNLPSSKVLPVIMISPYFFEKTVKIHLPSFKMLEYLVDYDNHPVFTTGPKGMKRGSASRMFTNLPSSLFSFPEEEGYSFCKHCDRWIHPRNFHCFKCGDCTSKDGRTYKHCNECGLCVKPMWNHCRSCKRCLPKDHVCQVNGKVGKQTTQTTKKMPEGILKSKRAPDYTNKPKPKKLKAYIPQSLTEEKKRNLAILKQVLENVNVK